MSRTHRFAIISACAILAAQTPAGASDYQWEKVLQAPVDESYFGPNDPRNSYDPLSNSHPLPGSQPRRNGGYAWGVTTHGDEIRSEEHTSELQSLMRSSYAVFCLTKKQTTATRPIRVHPLRKGKD